jgi:hypothetical protein
VKAVPASMMIGSALSSSTEGKDRDRAKELSRRVLIACLSQRYGLPGRIRLLLALISSLSARHMHPLEGKCSAVLSEDCQSICSR